MVIEWKTVRKVPLTVRYVQWTGGPLPPDAFTEEEWKRYRFHVFGKGANESMRIMTNHGMVYAFPGWFLIWGTEGEIYPIEPTVFEAVYMRQDVDLIRFVVDVVRLYREPGEIGDADFISWCGEKALGLYNLLRDEGVLDYLGYERGPPSESMTTLRYEGPEEG